MRTLMYSLAALVLLGIGAVGGYFYGLTIGQTRAVNIQTAFFQERGITPGAATAGGGATGGAAGGAAAAAKAAGGFGAAGQGAQGGFGQAGQGTIGSVRSVEGNIIEVSTAQGVIRVTVTDETRIQETVQQQLQVTDIKPDTNVVIQGDRDSQGNVTARAINVVPQGGAGFGAGGSGGQGSGQGGFGGGQRPGAGGTPQAGQGGAGGQRPAATPAR